ncbi:MAG: hypothetical protein ACRENS_01630, partial [Candidatus Eiseniibacteriota bacterium]
SQLLRSVEAAPGETAWARARARIEAQESAPPWLAWALRPAALAAAAGLLICTAGASIWIVGARTESTTLAQQVLDAGGASESAELGVTLNPVAAGDSGSLQ